MKISPNKILFIIGGFLCCNPTIAAPNPPEPVPPPPPGLSVDGWLVYMVVFSIIIGFYKIYSTKKASS